MCSSDLLSSRTERLALLLDFVFNLNDLPAFVKASFHVDMMGPMIFTGRLIFDIRRRFKRIVGAALAAAGFRYLLLWGSHEIGSASCRDRV